MTLQADVSRKREVQRMVEEAVRRFGRLINNAGILYPTRMEDIPEEEWDRIMDVNLKGTFLCAHAIIPLMKKGGGGKIVNFSSSAGKSVSTIGGAHYTASKAGVLGLTRHLAKELAPYNINVNAVCPGLIDTEMVRETISLGKIRSYEKSFPISRLGTPRGSSRPGALLSLRRSLLYHRSQSGHQRRRSDGVALNLKSNFEVDLPGQNLYTLHGRHKWRLLTAKFAKKTQRYAEKIFTNSAPTLGSLRLKEIPKKLRVRPCAVYNLPKG